jgi:hypothetical protein
MKTLPSRLREVIASDTAMCREQGGTVQLAPTYLQTGDFDGDGRADYLIDQEGVTCSTAASLYCGNSPCPVYALVAADGFAEPRHIPDDVFEPVVRPQGEISVVETGGVSAAGQPITLRWMLRGGVWRSAQIRRE